MKKSLFISFEGGEGCGKSTVCEYITQYLKDAGYPVIYTREPGGIVISEKIREIILDKENTAMEARTEALLFAASRRQHLIEKVIPALNEGKIVICDRFVDSSLVYQGYARGLGIDNVLNINQFAIENTFPDLTIYLKVTPQIGLARISHREKIDRLDVEKLNFHQSVYDGYEKICQMYPKRIKVVDAQKDLETVLKETLEIVLQKVKENV